MVCLMCENEVIHSVLEKRKKIGSNRNIVKHDLFQLCFGLFCETKN
jgi:hypothetical protein